MDGSEIREADNNGTVTISDEDGRTQSVTFDINWFGSTLTLWAGNYALKIDKFRLDNLDVSMKILFWDSAHNSGTRKLVYKLEVAVQGTTTQWIPVSSLGSKSTDPNADNIVAPGLLLTFKTGGTPPDVYQLSFEPSYEEP